VIFPIIKANEMHYFTNLFWQRTLHVSDRSTVHHQEYLNTVYTAIGICHASYVGVCWRGQYPDHMTTLADANRTSMTNTYCVYTVLRYS